jgi:hypothetical protein
VLLCQCLQVIIQPQHAIAQLIVHIPRLKLVGNIGCANEIVIEPRHGQQMLSLAIQHGIVRAVNLVKAKGIKVYIQCLHIHQPMGSIANPIHTDQGTMGVNQVSNLPNWVNGAQNIGRMG